MRIAKQERVNEERTTEARAWLEAGHTRYVYRAKIPANVLGPTGLAGDLSLEIEAIEAGGWKLEQLVFGSTLLLILVFARA